MKRARRNPVWLLPRARHGDGALFFWSKSWGASRELCLRASLDKLGISEPKLSAEYWAGLGYRAAGANSPGLRRSGGNKLGAEADSKWLAPDFKLELRQEVRTGIQKRSNARTNRACSFCFETENLQLTIFPVARSPSGKARVCKTLNGGSIPPRASNLCFGEILLHDARPRQVLWLWWPGTSIIRGGRRVSVL